MSVFVLQQMSLLKNAPINSLYAVTSTPTGGLKILLSGGGPSAFRLFHSFFHFISRAGRRLGANKRSLTALFWVIRCKTTHFQLRWGKANAFLKNWRSRPRDEGWSCEGRRQIAARHWRFPSAIFINYSNLFPLSVSNTGQPSAAFVFLKAFFY